MLNQTTNLYCHKKDTISKVLGATIKYGIASRFHKPKDSMGIPEGNHMIIHIKGSDNAFYRWN